MENVKCIWRNLACFASVSILLVLCRAKPVAWSSTVQRNNTLIHDFHVAS